MKTRQHIVLFVLILLSVPVIIWSQGAGNPYERRLDHQDRDLQDLAKGEAVNAQAISELDRRIKNLETVPVAFAQMQVAFEQQSTALKFFACAFIVEFLAFSGSLILIFVKSRLRAPRYIDP